MSEYRQVLSTLAKRALFAVPVGGFGWYLLASAEGGWSALPQLIFGMAFMLTGAIIIAPACARLAAEPAGSLFYPGRGFDRPQPAYGIPESQRKKGRFEDAFAGFERIAEEYPQEVNAYIAMIDIAIVDLRRPELARSVFDRAHVTLHVEEDRTALVRMYTAISSRLPALTAPPPQPIHMTPHAGSGSKPPGSSASAESS